VIKLGLIGLWGVLFISSCSVDEWRNVQRKKCDECHAQGGTCLLDKYCVFGPRPDVHKDAAVSDAATSDAAVSDAATSDAASGDAGTDAMVDTSCPEEGKEADCYTGKDPKTARQLPCHPGKHTCQDGHWTDCTDRTPEVEQCNNEDDDCDGASDEDLYEDPKSNACDVDGTEGVCKAGRMICLSGIAKCAQVNFPATDMCNNEDDDCDGKTDEETEVRCYLADSGCAQANNGDFICNGACKSGSIICRKGNYDETMCEGQVTPADAEACTASGDAMLDENCNGEVDEGCTCNPGTTCYTGSPVSTQSQSPCHSGTQTCSDSTHGTCMNEVTPEPETCANQGVDNDCDGKVDNVPMIGTSCTAQSTGRGACKNGAKWQCKDGARVCVDAAMSPERCDGQLGDEDCDGKSDEGIDLSTDEKNCGACGVTCGTGLTCCNKACVNTKSSNSNCGACGKACTGLNACSNGGCGLLGL
jgi:hypothetical protein